MTQKTAKKVAIKPLGHRVLVQRIEKEESLKGGIILPDSAKQKQEKAQVIAVGTGKKTSDGKDISIPVSVGDIVLLDKYSGQDITLDDEEYIIVKADDIIAIVS